jgi:hypothetical protein
MDNVKMIRWGMRVCVILGVITVLAGIAAVVVLSAPR